MHDALNRVTEVIRSNGTKTEVSYDAEDHITKIVNTCGSRIAPDLCIRAFDELVGIVVLIVIFCFADTIFDLLVRGPVSDLVIRIIMDCLFTALCFFCTACQFPVRSLSR